MLQSDGLEDAEEVEMDEATLVFISLYFASGSEFCVPLREEKVCFGK